MTVAIGTFSKKPIKGAKIIASLEAMAKTAPLRYTQDKYGSCFGLGFMVKDKEANKIKESILKKTREWGDGISGVESYFFKGLEKFSLILFKANIPVDKSLTDLTKLFSLDVLESQIYMAEYTNNDLDYSYRWNPPCWYGNFLVAPRGMITWYFASVPAGKKYQSENNEVHAELFARLIVEKYVKKFGTEKGLEKFIDKNIGVRTSHSTMILTFDGKFKFYFISNNRKSENKHGTFVRKGKIAGEKFSVFATEKSGIEAFPFDKKGNIEEIPDNVLHLFAVDLMN